MSRRFPLLVAIAVCAVGLVTAVNAAVGPLVVASGASPFAACTIGGRG